MSDKDRQYYYELKADPIRYAAYLERKRIERRNRQTDSAFESRRKRNWRAANRDKAKAMAAAHFAVERALKRGELIKPTTCSVCGQAGKIEAHHASYAPEDRLNVEWLCVTCHAIEHSMLRTSHKLKHKKQAQLKGEENGERNEAS